MLFLTFNSKSARFVLVNRRRLCFSEEELHSLGDSTRRTVIKRIATGRNQSHSHRRRSRFAPAISRAEAPPVLSKSHKKRVVSASSCRRDRNRRRRRGEASPLCRVHSLTQQRAASVRCRRGRLGHLCREASQSRRL